MENESNNERLECLRIGQVTVVRLLDRMLIGHMIVHQLGEELRRILEEHAPPMFVMNFARVEMVSSTLIGRLISFNSQVGERGGRLVLTNVHTQVHGVFVVARIDRLFDVRGDEADGVASF